MVGGPPGQGGPEGEPITTMEALLDAFPDTRFNIDPKMDAAVAPLVEALRRTNAWDRVNIAAFSDRRLLQFRRAAGRAGVHLDGPGGHRPAAPVRLRRAGRPVLRRLRAGAPRPGRTGRWSTPDS